MNLEKISANLWRDVVRSLDADIYRRILELASQTAPGPPKASTVHIAAADFLMVRTVATRPDKDRAKLTMYRKSKQAREVGDWAERVAVRFIQEQMPGCTTGVHRAAINEAPGWDIDYLDPNGVTQRVEVKGTIAAAFTGVEMTTNEIAAARVHAPGSGRPMITEK